MPVHDWTRVDAGIFHAIHFWWIGEMSGALNEGVLPEGYYSLPEQIIGSGTSAPAAMSGATALSESPPQVRYTETFGAIRTRRVPRSIVIRHTSGHHVIALIEVISPGNKASKSEIRSLLDKVTTVLSRGIHLLILDLFPPGPRDPDGIHNLIAPECGGKEVELPPGQRLTFASYAAGNPASAFVHPVGVGEVLRDMPLFLQPEWYVNVPLESTYQSAWRRMPDYWRAEVEGGP